MKHFVDQVKMAWKVFNRNGKIHLENWFLFSVSLFTWVIEFKMKKDLEDNIQQIHIKHFNIMLRHLHINTIA